MAWCRGPAIGHIVRFTGTSPGDFCRLIGAAMSGDRPVYLSANDISMNPWAVGWAKARTPPPTTLFQQTIIVGGHGASRLSPPYERHCANGFGRSWNFTTFGNVPLPPSMWNGARVPVVAHTPLPFQPPLGSSMRPSIHLA